MHIVPLCWADTGVAVEERTAVLPSCAKQGGMLPGLFYAAVSHAARVRRGNFCSYSASSSADKRGCAQDARVVLEAGGDKPREGAIALKRAGFLRRFADGIDQDAAGVG